MGVFFLLHMLLPLVFDGCTVLLFGYFRFTRSLGSGAHCTTQLRAITVNSELRDSIPEPSNP
jgi:hypothetical protein